MPKPNPKARENILNAAEDIFAHKGYGGARTAEIGKQAGVNKALIHYYFTNKEQLYHAVMDRLLFDLIQISQDLLKKNYKERRLSEELFDAFFDYAAKHRNFARLTTVESAGEQSRYLENMLRNFFKPLFDRAVDFITSQQKKGNIKKGVDAEQFLISAYLMLLGYFAESRFVENVLEGDVLGPKVLAKRKKHLKSLIIGTLY